MEAFEHVVRVYLESEGFVVSGNVKFPVRRQTKRLDRVEFQTHGYEIDVVAARRNELMLGSIKSFFGSKGVERQGFKGIANPLRRTHFDDYRLFNDADLRNEIVRQAAERYGYAESHVRVALYVGRFYAKDREAVERHLRSIVVGKHAVRVVSLDVLAPKLIELSKSGTYSNDPVVMTVKMLREANLLSSPS